MDRRSAFDDRNYFNIFLAIASGILLGSSAFFMKIFMAGFFFSLESFLSLTFVMGCLLALMGFFLMQKALHRGFVSLVIPITVSISIALPILLAVVFLNEIIGMKWLGITLVLIGTIALGKR